MPTEAEILAARLARIKTLLNALEGVSAKSVEQRDTYLKLKRELESTRAALKLIDPVEPI